MGQLHFEKATFETSVSLDTLKVETSRFQAMGQLHRPTEHHALHVQTQARGHLHHGVAVQVDPFESKGLKPGFHVIGSRVETRRLSTLKPGFPLSKVRGLKPGAFQAMGHN
jgi:hypothetical protein